MPSSAVNAVYRGAMRDTHRYQIYFGGASSGKSCFLATRAVLDTLQGRNTLIVRQVARTLRTSCWNEVCKAIARMNLTACFRVNRTEMTVTARCNGAQMLFAGLDDVEKIKSVTPQCGALTDIWMEEATECAYADFKQLDKRLRGQTRHEKRITLSFNPVYKTHWIYREFFENWDESRCFYSDNRVSILKTTYRDNAFLTDDDRAALEAERDPYYRQVYTLGNWGVQGDVIFTAWHQEDLSHRALCEERALYGLDFGFAADPTAVVRCAYDRDQRRVYVYDEICEKGLTNRQLAERLAPFVGSGYVICDSAEPKSIAELRGCGIFALPARKGPDSLMHGVQWLRGQEIVVDPRCKNLIRELTLYRWQRDREGNTLRRPQDSDNHLIDAMRYALENEMSERYALSLSR